MYNPVRVAELQKCNLSRAEAIAQATQEFNYLSDQLLQYAPYPHSSGENGQYRLKLHSEQGETKWLNISPAQADAIGRILESD